LKEPKKTVPKGAGPLMEGRGSAFSMRRLGPPSGLVSATGPSREKSGRSAGGPGYRRNPPASFGPSPWLFAAPLGTRPGQHAVRAPKTRIAEHLLELRPWVGIRWRWKAEARETTPRGPQQGQRGKSPLSASCRAERRALMNRGAGGLALCARAPPRPRRPAALFSGSKRGRHRGPWISPRAGPLP